MNETDDLLGYDADHDDPRQYCLHGTFIGSWWGPDYMCWACEEGLPLRQWEDHCFGQAYLTSMAEVNKALQIYSVINRQIQWPVAYRAQMAVDMLTRDEWQFNRLHYHYERFCLLGAAAEYLGIHVNHGTYAAVVGM